MHVTSDCVIELPYESKVALKSEPDKLSATVVEIEMISSSVAKLVVEPDPDTEPVAFMPGQYVHLSIPGGDQTRSYSFANAAFDTGRYTFYIKVLQQGAMSDYLSGEAKSGDQMTLTGPFGRFYLRPVERPVLMVAGGTGLAPMLSMLDTMVTQDGMRHPVHLLYGANRPDELFGLDQISTYKNQGLDISTQLSIVDPDSNWKGITGHITDLMRPEMLNGGDCDVYLCGPPPMIDAAETWLFENGVNKSRVHAEKFVPS
tara:strand:- start:15506 stop:16282 length:777 start_codon:yes stop_codon:yes gene_type:complete